MSAGIPRMWSVCRMCVYSCVTSSRYQSSTSPSGDMSSGAVTFNCTVSYGRAEAEPFAPFRRWRDEAWQGEPNAHAMVLATTTSEGRPSARAVLLKGLDDRGFVFYTSYTSRKARDVAALD